MGSGWAFSHMAAEAPLAGNGRRHEGRIRNAAQGGNVRRTATGSRTGAGRRTWKASGCGPAHWHGPHGLIPCPSGSGARNGRHHGNLQPSRCAGHLCHRMGVNDGFGQWTSGARAGRRDAWLYHRSGPIRCRSERDGHGLGDDRRGLGDPCCVRHGRCHACCAKRSWRRPSCAGRGCRNPRTRLPDDPRWFQPGRPMAVWRRVCPLVQPIPAAGAVGWHASLSPAPSGRRSLPGLVPGHPVNVLARGPSRSEDASHPGWMRRQTARSVRLPAIVAGASGQHLARGWRSPRSCRRGVRCGRR